MDGMLSYHVRGLFVDNKLSTTFQVCTRGRSLIDRFCCRRSSRWEQSAQKEMLRQLNFPFKHLELDRLVYGAYREHEERNEDNLFERGQKQSV